MVSETVLLREERCYNLLVQMEGTEHFSKRYNRTIRNFGRNELVDNERNQENGEGQVCECE